MASHEDLDLIRLFGLSAEEASGLGLDPSVQLPRPAAPAPAERRLAAQPAPVAERRLAGRPAPVAQHRPGAHAERSAAARPAAPQRVEQCPQGAHAEPVAPEGAPGIVVPESVTRLGTRPVAEGHACSAGTERAGSAPLMSPHESTAALGAQGAHHSDRLAADRDPDRARRDSELALLAMFENPATCTSESLSA